MLNISESQHFEIECDCSCNVSGFMNKNNMNNIDRVIKVTQFSHSSHKNKRQGLVLVIIFCMYVFVITEDFLSDIEFTYHIDTV